MRHKPHLLASSVFFLAGCVAFSVPALVRGMLYATSITAPVWRYPNDTIELMVPGFFTAVGLVAFVLSAVSIAIPYMRKARGPRS